MDPFRAKQFCKSENVRLAHEVLLVLPEASLRMLPTLASRAMSAGVPSSCAAIICSVLAIHENVRAKSL